MCVYVLIFILGFVAGYCVRFYMINEEKKILKEQLDKLTEAFISLEINKENKK